MESNQITSPRPSFLNSCSSPLRTPDLTYGGKPMETLLSLLLGRYNTDNNKNNAVDYDSIYSVFVPEDVATFQLLTDPLEDFDTVNDLLDRGANLHVCDNTNSTPLLRATRSGQYQIVELLLQRGANPAHKDFTSLTALVWATHYGEASLIRLLLRHHADSTALMVATERNMPDAVRIFCSDARVDVNVTNDEGRLTPLMHAANAGYEQVVNELLQHPSIEVNATDASGATPLSRACRHNHLAISTALLQAGANVNQADQWGDTPLLLAAKCGYVKLVKVLLQYGADVNVHDLYGTTVLLAACDHDSADVMTLVLPHVFNVEETDSCHLSPLFLATDRGNVEMVRLLLQTGASIHESADDFTPFLLAIAQGRAEIVSEMLQYACSDDDDPTTLLTALSADHLDVVYLLLRNDPVAQLQSLAKVMVNAL